MNEDLLPNDPKFWNQLTPIYCDTVRIIGIFMCIAAVIGIILNGALVYSFIRYKALRTSPNIHVMFIAIVGLLASCTILPSTGTSSVYCRWLYKRAGCQLSGVIAFFYGCSSSYLLCVVSLSRCYIIMRPFAANHITGVRTSCCINWYDRRLTYISFTFFLFLFVYFIPLVILVATNTVTLIGFKQMREKIKRGIHTVFTRKRIEMEQRIVKSIIITTLGFIFTWTPYAVALFISAFRGKYYAMPPLITFISACFAKSSVIWTPLLFIGTSTQFKLRFVNVNRLNYWTRANRVAGKIVHTFALVRNNNNSITIRTLHTVPDKRKHPTIQTKIYSI
ncbi:unnamed protein product [Rotaria sp. Silwood1]|nr:unnamed protein product [Rotaria sp. Silwood1]CAF1065857.1 unnamed protein product [Rotaria sp. Silwood1]CAF3431456.1 unnamed protein product [Rotaria sp. Silwood1]CAF4633089.1 unnamed protein product [Rotaria sp. Silwood1]